MTKYVINTTQSNIGISALKKVLPIGGWAELTNEEAKNPEVEEAVRREWVKISLTKPEASQVFTPNIEMSEPAVHGSKTIPGKKKETA
jgi:hypothetical protein